MIYVKRHQHCTYSGAKSDYALITDSPPHTVGQGTELQIPTSDNVRSHKVKGRVHLGQILQDCRATAESLTTPATLTRTPIASVESLYVFKLWQETNASEITPLGRTYQLTRRFETILLLGDPANHSTTLLSGSEILFIQIITLLIIINTQI